MSLKIKPIILTILDGWGYSEEQEYNAIAAAHKPNWDHLWETFPHTLIRTSGAAVGLPAEQMGNSEVGHMNLGAGRVVYQEFTRVSRAIRTGSFFSNLTLTKAVDQALADDKAVHVLGLLSPGGVHSHEEQIHAMVRLAVERGVKQVYVHAFLDGRDTPPKSAASSLEKIQGLFDELGCGQLVSIIGRYYAMDRDHRWPRIQAAYDLITNATAEYSAESAMVGLEAAYKRGETDEFVRATSIVPAGQAPVKIHDGDVVFFMNYRSDRARQITRAFIEPGFDGFQREVRPKLGEFVSLTEYSKDFANPVAFPPDQLKNVFGEYLANLGMRQLRIAETEKYAHVTFFFNGGREQPFEGETRILVPSPKVTTYDLKPEMSANEITDRLVDAIHSDEFDVIVCNFANPDMVGHTGNFDAAVKAIETIDECLGKVVSAAREVGGELLITADHGNAEQMRGVGTGQAHTAHTTNLVPLLYVGRPANMSNTGSLSDVAPSMLYLMGVEQPAEMGGQSLLELQSE